MFKPRCWLGSALATVPIFGQFRSSHIARVFWKSTGSFFVVSVPEVKHTEKWDNLPRSHRPGTNSQSQNNKQINDCRH